MESLNNSSFPFPPSIASTPNNNNTSPAQFPLAPGAPVRPSLQRDTGNIAAARRISFETEIIEDSEEEDDTGFVPFSTLTTEDIRALHDHNEQITDRFVELCEAREVERKKVIDLFHRISDMDKELSDLQNLSWRIAFQLDRTDPREYIGL